MKAFQSLASTVIHGVQNTYTAYNKGYHQETPAEDNDTATLEEDERDRRLADVQGEEDKEVLAAKTSVMFQAVAVPHDSMATIVEKAREQRLATLNENVQPVQATVQTPDLAALVESERERRSLDSAEAQSREAIAAQVSVLLKAANFGNSHTFTANVDQSLTDEERARRIADVQEAQNHEALAAKTSLLIQNQFARTSDVQESLPAHSVSNMSASAGENTDLARLDENQIHPGIETPLLLRDDTPMEVRQTEEAIVNEVAVRDSFPVMNHNEMHVAQSSSIVEKLPIVVAVPEATIETNEPQRETENVTAIPEVAYQAQPQPHVVTELQPEAINQPQTWSQSYNMQAYSEVQPRSIPTPPHVESHAATSSVQLYPMIVQRMEAPSAYSGIAVRAPSMEDNTRHLMPAIQTSQAYQTVPSVEQPVLPAANVAAPALVPAVELHASSIAMLQADAMEQTNSAPATEWVESYGHPSTANNAPVMPVLVKSLSAKDLKQINRNINSHHNDALKEVRKAQKSLAKVEKYTAKGNTSKAEKYQREYIDHRARATQHEHVVVEEKAKIAATQTVAATPAL